MLTLDELAAIPVFSTLPQAALADLAGIAADIHLNAGEYAVHEGDEPALFVVISGTFEVIKLVDGIERRLGTAQRRTDLRRGAAHLRHAVSELVPCGGIIRVCSRSILDTITHCAAASPDLAKAVGDLARERIGGLQGIAAEPRKARVTLVGQRWDSACLELRRFLVRNQITFDWLTPDDPHLSERWSGPLPGEDDCPGSYGWPTERR